MSLKFKEIIRWIINKNKSDVKQQIFYIDNN